MNKILVIDDERPTLSMFSLFLKAYGFEVLTAENGEIGIEVFEQHRPPIVLTDIKMPGMDGLEVLRSIKKIDPLVEVIVITGHGDMDIAIQALNLNAVDFINKPVQKESLDAALRRANERLSLGASKVNELHSRIERETMIIEIKGNITTGTEPYLLSEYMKAEEQGVRRIIFKFDDSSSVNGAGLASLAQIVSRADNDGIAVAVCGLSENFHKVLSVVGVASIAKVYPDLEDALSDG